MTTRYLLSPVLLFLLSLGLTLGCGSKKSAPAQLSGKVTYKGAAVTGGTLAFHSDAGAYTAVINADGTYTVTDLPEGEVVVTVDTEDMNPERKIPEYNEKSGGALGTKYGKSAQPPAPPQGSPPGGKTKQESSPVPEGAPKAEVGQYVKIPRTYSDKTKSSLKVTLQAGKQQHNFELKD